jgi:hypothetical protein
MFTGTARKPKTLMVTGEMIEEAKAEHAKGYFSMSVYQVSAQDRFWVDIPEVLSSLPGEEVPAVRERPM